MLDNLKSFFATKLGRLLAIFLLSGLISVATQIGCKPCNVFLSGILTTVENSETTSTSTTAATATSNGIVVPAADATPAAAQ